MFDILQVWSYFPNDAFTAEHNYDFYDAFDGAMLCRCEERGCDRTQERKAFYRLLKNVFLKIHTLLLNVTTKKSIARKQ